ncbi:thiamine pyrophosphate-binding protein [Candidatus Gracilibacteria bacterium]|nr:thiamine pyrophosphate-binding protein [Candidatus Gracilibacteria bacterium]
MKASSYIISFLQKQGSDKIFSLSGGMITHLEDSVFLNTEMKLVSMKHEQAGAFAAEGFSRVSEHSGVAMGTSGPGATNMITGIASAFFDSIPVLYITGQVNISEITPEHSGVRQTGFQETKIIPIVTPITKYATQIQDIKHLRYELEKAYFIMNHGRKGPVLLDIPMDIQRMEVDPDELESYFNSSEYIATLPKTSNQTDLIKIRELLQNAKRPLVLIGGGIRLANATTVLEKFLNISHIPVVASLMGIDSIDHSYGGYIGMIGSYGIRRANIAVTHADILLVLGSRLDIRQTGAKRIDFARNATIIHIDIDESELGHNVGNTTIRIQKDVNQFLTEIIDTDLEFPRYEPWHTELSELSKLLPVFNSKINSEGFLNPNYICSRFNELATSSTVFVNDVGQNQMWSSQSISITKGQRLLNCGGLGSMGFSLPTSIGASFVPGVDRVISINGDGGFQMNMQELETIAHHNLPIGIIVMNNESLGMVREFQDTYFEGRTVGTVLGYSCPNLEKIANAYSIPFFLIHDLQTLDSVLVEVAKLIGPYLIDIRISPKSLVEPKILFGNSIDNQSPILSDITKDQISLIFQNHV